MSRRRAGCQCTVSERREDETPAEIARLARLRFVDLSDDEVCFILAQLYPCNYTAPELRDVEDDRRGKLYANLRYGRGAKV